MVVVRGANQNIRNKNKDEMVIWLSNPYDMYNNRPEVWHEYNKELFLA